MRSDTTLISPSRPSFRCPHRSPRRRESSRLSRSTRKPQRQDPRSPRSTTPGAGGGACRRLVPPETKGYEAAKASQEATARWLERINADAASSLREGLEETLTVVRLGVPRALRRTPATTNPIEVGRSEA